MDAPRPLQVICALAAVHQGLPWKEQLPSALRVFVEFHSHIRCGTVDLERLRALPLAPLGDDGFMSMQHSSILYGCNGTAFSSPMGLCTDLKGRIIVADKDNRRLCILKNSSFGIIKGVETVLECIKLDVSFSQPWDVCMDGLGLLAIADRGIGQVVVAKEFHDGWKVVCTLKGNGSTSAAVCFEKDGSLLMADDHVRSDHAIVRFPRLGDYEFGPYQPVLLDLERAGYKDIMGISADREGRIGFAEFCGDRARIFDPKSGEDTVYGDRKSYGKHPPLKYPRGVCMDGAGNLLVCDCDNNQILVVKRDGTLLSLPQKDALAVYVNEKGQLLVVGTKYLAVI